MGPPLPVVLESGHPRIILDVLDLHDLDDGGIPDAVKCYDGVPTEDEFPLQCVFDGGVQDGFRGLRISRPGGTFRQNGDHAPARAK